MTEMMLDQDNSIDLSSIQRKKSDQNSTNIQTGDFDFGAKMMDKAVIKAAKTSKLKHPKSKPKNEKDGDDKEKQRMVLILQFYLLEFPDKLSTFKGISFHKK